jgi:hypothetical protein
MRRRSHPSCFGFSSESKQLAARTTVRAANRRWLLSLDALAAHCRQPPDAGRLIAREGG